MDIAGDSLLPFDSFKSKKVVCSSFNKHRSADEASDLSPWSFKTSEKPVHHKFTEAANHLRKLDLKSSVSPEPLPFSTASSETLITKQKTPKPLPERYKVLDTFFSSLAFSIRHLELGRCSSTFTNVSCMVEKTTNMRFGYSHLGQLKFIFPEGIKIEKVYVFDDVPYSPLKPDLLLTLNYHIIPNGEKLRKSKIKNSEMKKLFKSRLYSYYESNPEGDEVPVETLPEPFDYGPWVERYSLGPEKDTVSQQQQEPEIRMVGSLKPFFSILKKVDQVSSPKYHILPLSKNEDNKRKAMDNKYPTILQGA